MMGSYDSKSVHFVALFPAVRKVRGCIAVVLLLSAHVYSSSTGGCCEVQFDETARTGGTRSWLACGVEGGCQVKQLEQLSRRQLCRVFIWCSLKLFGFLCG